MAARLRPYFSILQRKALQPNDFSDLEELERHILAFGRRNEQVAQPFEWKFTRNDLDHPSNDSTHHTPPPLAA